MVNVSSLHSPANVWGASSIFNWRRLAYLWLLLVRSFLINGCSLFNSDYINVYIPNCFWDNSVIPTIKGRVGHPFEYLGYILKNWTWLSQEKTFHKRWKLDFRLQDFTQNYLCISVILQLFRGFSSNCLFKYWLKL